MRSLWYILWTASLLSIGGRAQQVTSLVASELCHNSQATLSTCNWLYTQLHSCFGTQVASGTAFESCYCNQQYFNAIYDCESEQRLCFENNLLDGQMQALAQNWNSACGPNLSFTPSTPVLSELSSTYGLDACTAAQAACASWSFRAAACLSSSTVLSDYQSCSCASNIISLEYECAVVGNVSCLQKPGTVTNLFGRRCPNFSAVLNDITATAPATSSASTTAASSMSAASASLSISTPALPGSTSTTSIAATSTPSTGNINKTHITSVGYMLVLLLLFMKGMML